MKWYWDILIIIAMIVITILLYLKWRDILTFVDDLKNVTKRKPSRKEQEDFVDTIKDDPKYAIFISKLREEYEKRQFLLNSLEKVELNIDFILDGIVIQKQKDNIGKSDDKERSY